MDIQVNDLVQDIYGTSYKVTIKGKTSFGIAGFPNEYFRPLDRRTIKSTSASPTYLYKL